MLYWRANGGSLDDILGLAVLKFCPLCEIYLLRFYTATKMICAGKLFAGYPRPVAVKCHTFSEAIT